MYARTMPISQRPDSRKPQPILFSASSLPLIEGTIRGTDRLEGARNGRICVFPSSSGSRPGILVQHELKIEIPDEAKSEAPLPVRPSHDGEEQRRSYYGYFRQLILSRTLTGRQDALGALEWNFYQTFRQFYVNSIATAGNGPSKNADSFSMLMNEAERLARMLGAGSILLHSETIIAARLFALGYHLVPRELKFLPEYIKGLS